MTNSITQAASICASVAEDIRVRNAAHEMLDVLRRVRFILESPLFEPYSDGAGTLTAVRVVIAKAEGRRE